MKYGYARVSTEDQNPALQLAALKRAGCEKTFRDERSSIYYATLDYLAVHPEISQICTNDMALPFGGKFDLGQDWQSPHSQHDRGQPLTLQL